MDNKKFEAMLVLLVPEIVSIITEKYLWNEVAASNSFYKSKVYESLEHEETKLWHLSPLTLFNMFDEEQKTGCFTFPEEA